MSRKRKVKHKTNLDGSQCGGILGAGSIPALLIIFLYGGERFIYKLCLYNEYNMNMEVKRKWKTK